MSEGLTLRQAAVIAGLGYLLNPVSYAEFSLFPRLVVPGNIVQTVANISAHHALFVIVIFSYFISFIGDIVIAWALYVLLAPVNKALSLLAALFRLVYVAVGFASVLDLATAYRVVTTPEYLKYFGEIPRDAQVDLLLHSFRYDWVMALVIFGIHLVLVGCLIFRSGYIPKLIGAVLVINGCGWILNSLQPYLYPSVNTDFLFITFFGELIFMLWLLIMGWRIRQPVSNP